MIKRADILGCFMASLCPSAVLAVGADYPALGVKFANMPADAKGVSEGEIWKGYSARISVGKAGSLVISRFDPAVPQGNIADVDYRVELDTQLGIPLQGPVQKLVTFAGHPAWLVGSALRVGSTAAYQCTYLLVVGAHLYEFAVSGVGEAGAAKAAFEVAGEFAGTAEFEPIVPPAGKAIAPGTMPPFLWGRSTGVFYPDSARRLGEQGALELTFSIDDAGAAKGIQAAGDTNAEFVKVAESILAAGGFKVPPGWGQSAASKQTYTMQFDFELMCPDSHPPPQVVPEAQLVTICGSDLQH